MTPVENLLFGSLICMRFTTQYLSPISIKQNQKTKNIIKMKTSVLITEI